MNLPILYSFRRCPYAMRARLSLGFIGQGYILREVDLKNKPKAMLEASPKGTVPVLVLPDGQILEESLDIVLWAQDHDSKGVFLKLNHDQAKEAESLVSRFMRDFVSNLNRYKYPERYELEDGEAFKKPLDDFLDTLEMQFREGHFQETKPFFLFGDQLSWADIALFPLIRQMRIVDEEVFDAMNRPQVLSWFSFFINHPIFAKIMEKFKPWDETEPLKQGGEIISFSS